MTLCDKANMAIMTDFQATSSPTLGSGLMHGLAASVLAFAFLYGTSLLPKSEMPQASQKALNSYMHGMRTTPGWN